MSLLPTDCTILNAGAGAWAFEEHAAHLSRVLWVDVSATPRKRNFLLSWDSADSVPAADYFVPLTAIRNASDKRLQAELFSRFEVATPETHLVETAEDVRRIVEQDQNRQWVLKYPIGCGGLGHQKLSPGFALREDWPRPYVVQEFIKLERPEVYRVYCIDQQLFGWNARRYPPGVKPSPWVAHARGARYYFGEPLPEAAGIEATKALQATGLFDSFGCVDLLCTLEGKWLVLEAGTDGLFNHVDRDTGNPDLLPELDRRLANAFWKDSSAKPWGSDDWKLQD